VNGTSIEHYDSASLDNPMLRELVELVRYRDLIRQLVARNIKIRYKRSVLGIAWSMLGPLLTMTALSLVFTHVFRLETPRYALYLFPGLLLWSFFAQTTSIIMAEVIAGVDIWRRIYTPRTAFAVAAVVTGLLHLAMAMIPLALLMIVFGAPFHPAQLASVFMALCAALFALGVGLTLAAWAGYFADVADMYQILLGTWLYVTPVIYPASVIPENYRWLLYLNPMTYFIEGFRQPIYEQSVPSAGIVAGAVFVSAAALTFGWWLFTRSADDLVRRT